MIILKIIVLIFMLIPLLIAVFIIMGFIKFTVFKKSDKDILKDINK